LVCGDELLGEKPVKVDKEARERVSMLHSRREEVESALSQIIVQRKFVSLLDHLLQSRILPQVLEGSQILDGYGLVWPQIFLLHYGREVDLRQD
jgi:hypothetical protein